MTTIDQLEERVRAADPAAGIDRNPRGPTGVRVFSETLRRVEAAPAGHGHRRVGLSHPSAPTRTRRRSLALAAMLAVAAIVLAVVPDLSSDAPAYAIRPLPNGKLVIDWSDWGSFAPSADAVAAELREYGVDVTINTGVGSPSIAGDIIVATFPGEGVEGGALPQGLSIGPEGPGGVTWTIDPRLFRGPITLVVAVPASEGERYQYMEEVFEPGEVLGGLQCALGEPLRAEDVAARLGDLGITAEWYVTGPKTEVTADGYTSHEARVADMPDGVILEGTSLDETTVRFLVAPDGRPLSDYPEAHLSNVPCTPEQAAPWK